MQALNYGLHKERFHKWLISNHSEPHAKTLTSYSNRYLPPVIEDQFKLKEVYENVKVGKRSLSLAIRNLFNYMEEFSLVDEGSLNKYRKVVKVPKTGTDDYVPETSEVVKAFKRITSEDYKLLFKVMLYGGLRIVEAVQLLHVFDKGRLMTKGQIAKYPLSMDRGTKRVLYAYMPSSFTSELRQVAPNSNALKVYFGKRDIPPKYLRKWNYNFLIEHNVPESVCDFIQGRSLGKSVGGMHYLAKVKQADRFYGRVVRKLPVLN